MADVKQLDPKQRSVYRKLLSQIKSWSYNHSLQLASLNYNCKPDSLNALPDDRLRNEPVEDIKTSWQYSFEKTKSGFRANVWLRNEIMCEGTDDISLEVEYIVYYKSSIDLPSSLVDKFAYEKVLPHVWPYFRELAQDIYFKSGLLWVIMPIEPDAVSG